MTKQPLHQPIGNGTHWDERARAIAALPSAARIRALEQLSAPERRSMLQTMKTMVVQGHDGPDQG